MQFFTHFLQSHIHKSCTLHRRHWAANPMVESVYPKTKGFPIFSLSPYLKQIHWYFRNSVFKFGRHLEFANAHHTISYGRETAWSLRRFRLTSSVIRNIMHKIAFLGHPMCANGRNVNGLFESFNAKKLCSRFSSREYSFTRKTAN